MSSTVVAVVLGAAQLGWFGQHGEHLRLGFHFRGRPIRSCTSWRRYVDDMLAGSRVFCCSCIFVFMRACYPVPLTLVSVAGTPIHMWVDVELRVNIKNPNRSWVHNRGPQRKSTFPFGGLGFVEVVWVPFVVLCWVICPRTTWGGSCHGRCRGTGVYGISSGA